MNLARPPIRIRPLWIALALSLLVHVLLLGHRWFEAQEQDRRLSTPLSVVLVNASTKSPPQNAQKLAQADLDGGGLTINQEASAMHRARLGADAKLEALEKRQKQLLSKLEADKKQASGKRSGEEAKQITEMNGEVARVLLWTRNLSWSNVKILGTTAWYGMPRT